ncbi:ABC transporter ATP-binding protein [Paeniglutamicibacter psychrophenolicus]|uniref:Peptide/nickel transport system ATP-binding protein n=1 Tax=Paeniglutamicibacter psychrophenolicus TaxID=257454 RepID=A0ABS4WAW8_9MICC|nr:ABC transporter ATP-binding protein [Paeniglutamicibacter psychrophenolicus]MBP2373293.1 peptide/nickel transport system ATP-binding protein [Paeniglutamicibacter psychrophenolicus]
MSTPNPVLRVENLHVSFGATEVVAGVSFTVNPGETLALVGESGSGKSVTARSLIGLAGAGSRVRAGALQVAGTDARSLSQRAWRTLRGRTAGFILQDALTSLDPLRTIGKEIDDALRLHSSGSGSERAARVIELLESVGLDDPVRRAGQRSGELSGGMRQRALIASAIALDPVLLIADEPTTALDATIAAQVMDLLGGLGAAGSGMLLISHDLAAVATLADSIAVMQGGRIVESGPAARILGDPQHPYTRALLAAVPAGKPRFAPLSPASTATSAPLHGTPPAVQGPSGSRPVLRAESLSKSFKVPGSPDFAAVKDVGFELHAGRTLGVVGESGSGKTTTARMALGLLAPDTGSVELFGEPWSQVPEAARRTRRTALGAIYQDPLSSFDPRLSAGSLLADAVSFGSTRNPRKHAARISELLALVGLKDELAGRNPATLSGGQRQRLAIARALAPNPRVLICDEPVSALDVSIQAQVLDLLDDLQFRLGLSYLFISHDLSVIRHMSDEVLVMQGGKVVESGATESVFTAPVHPYTRTLLAASPGLVPGR